MAAKRKIPKRVALYVRTSTANGQTTRNQERELQAVAERHGWDVAAVYRDQGISGAKGRDKRPGLERLMQAVARRDVDMVAAWSVGIGVELCVIDAKFIDQIPVNQRVLGGHFGR
jgi:hypothetical protein